MSLNNNKNINVLLVEDDEIDIESVYRAIKKTELSIKLKVARNGVEALSHLGELLAEKKAELMPNLIIIDINMPKMGGIELLEKLRSSPRLNLAKIVVLTNSNDVKDRLVFANLHVDAYINKPLNIIELVDFCKNMGMQP